jgi:hypothetical protein
MALSNIAWILASNGYDVLLIDWDLEAPGLIDFLWEAARTNMTAAESNRGPGDDFPKLEDYVVGLDYDFGKRGSIGFVPAGRQDENYAQRVNTFNWDNFYERLGRGWLLQYARMGCFGKLGSNAIPKLDLAPHSISRSSRSP